jgi:hypothetical protein
MAILDPPIKFTLDAPLKGVWTHASPASCPAQTWPGLTNVDIPAGVITAMNGNEVFLDNDYRAGTINLLMDRRIAGSTTQYLVSVLSSASSDERLYLWGSPVASDWNPLRIFPSNAARWWSWVQYGTDLYISNPTDGVYRYDGTTMIPAGAKTIATMEASEDALWTNGAVQTSQYCEGVQSRRLTDTGAPPTATFHPAASMDLVTGRYQARAYEVDKSPGTDYYHFAIRFNSSEPNVMDTSNTKVVFTDTAGKTLTFPMTTWLTSRGGSVLAAHPDDDSWYHIYLLASSGTEVATYNPALFHSVAFTLTGNAGHAEADIDDLYVIYSVTMPACQIITEWKNMLWGARTTANPDTLFYSPVQSPDEFDALATFPIKARGETVTGLSSFFSQLTVPCDTTTHSISGSTEGSTYPLYIFSQQMVSKEFGGSSHRSIIEANNRLYWWYQNMIVEYRGTGLAKISYAVDVTLGLADKTELDYIVGAQYQTKNQIWWTWRRTLGPGTISAAVITGAGLDDATSGGTYLGADKAAVTYTVTIDGVGAINTFKWKKGTGAETTGVAMTGAAQALTDGVTIQFTAITGHTNGDLWTITATPYDRNDRVLRYDYIEEAFLLTEGLATPLLLRTFESGVERLLSVDAYNNDANRRIWRQDSSTLKFVDVAGANTNIAYTVELPPLALPNVSMEWDYASLQYLTNTGNLVVAYRVSDHLRALIAAGYTTLETIDQAVAGELGKIRLGDRSPYLQLRLTSTAVPFQIQCPIVVWTRSMGDERGTA